MIQGYKYVLSTCKHCCVRGIVCPDGKLIHCSPEIAVFTSYLNGLRPLMVTMLRKALQNFPPHKRKHIFFSSLEPCIHKRRSSWRAWLEAHPQFPCWVLHYMSPPTPLPLTICSCKLWQKTNKHPFILVSVDLSCRSVSRQCTLRSRWTLVHRVCKLHSCLHKAFRQLWRHTFAHLLVPCSSTPSGLIITLPCFSKKSGLLFLVNSCLPRT